MEKPKFTDYIDKYEVDKKDLYNKYLEGYCNALEQYVKQLEEENRILNEALRKENQNEIK